MHQGKGHTSLSSANFTSFKKSSAAIFAFVHFVSNCVPAFPGATKIRFTSDDRDNRHASACSRAPLPIKRILSEADIKADKSVSQRVRLWMH